MLQVLESRSLPYCIVDISAPGSQVGQETPVHPSILHSSCAGVEKLHAREGEEAGGSKTCVASTDLQWGGVQRGELAPSTYDGKLATLSGL